MNTNKTKITVLSKGYAIDNGPSEPAIYRAFSEAYSESPQRAIFTLCKGDGAPKVCVTLTALEHESGNNYSLNFKGHCVGELQNSATSKCEGYYNARTRKGYIRIAQ